MGSFSVADGRFYFLWMAELVIDAMLDALSYAAVAHVLVYTGNGSTSCVFRMEWMISL